MALTAPARLSVSVVDELGTEASTVAYLMVDPTQPLAALAASAQQWATDLDAVIGGKITKVSAILLPGLPPGLKANPVAGSRVEQTAVINFASAGNVHRFGMAIPSVADSKLAGGRLNLSDAAVQALVVLLTTATGTQAFATPAQQIIVSAVDAILSFRKRRKSLTRSSFEYDHDTTHGGV